MRSIGLLVAGMLTMGAFALAPATAHIGDTTGHLLKHVDKRFVSEKEHMRVGPVNMAANQADVLLGKTGPFTWWGQCEANDDQEGIESRIIVKTAQDNAHFSGNDFEADFDVADNDNPVSVVQSNGDPVGGDQTSSSSTFQSIAHEGTAVTGTAIALSNFGTNCRFYMQMIVFNA